MRTNASVVKRVKTKDEKGIAQAYQLVRSCAQIERYPAVKDFKIIFEGLAKPVPAAKNANSISTSGSRNWTTPVMSILVNDEGAPIVR